MSRQDKLIIFCARIDAHFGVVLSIINEFSQWDIVGLYDDDPQLQGGSVHGIPVLGRLADYPIGAAEGVTHFFCATGNNDLRARCHEMAVRQGHSMANVIHPSAVIAKSARVGSGVFVGANAAINNNTSIGDGTVINTGAVIEHDNRIEDFVNVSSGTTTAGRVTIHSKAFLGVGVSVIPDITIGASAVVGAGSVLIEDVAPNTRVAGSPAKQIR